MTSNRAQQHGVLRVTASGLFVTGPGILWSVNSTDTGVANVHDNTTFSGPLLAVLAADPTNALATKFYSFPQGIPFEVGIYIAGGSTAIITYTPLD